MPLDPSKSTLFPYTTLFRSSVERPGGGEGIRHLERQYAAHAVLVSLDRRQLSRRHRLPEADRRPKALRRLRCAPVRSEEHTSELQSLRHLVCRLLLEKKKND